MASVSIAKKELTTRSCFVSNNEYMGERGKKQDAEEGGGG